MQLSRAAAIERLRNISTESIDLALVEAILGFDDTDQHKLEQKREKKFEIGIR